MWIDNGRIYDGSLDAPAGMVRLAFSVGDGWQRVERVMLSRTIDGDNPERIDDEPLGVADCRMGSHERGRVWNLIVTVPREWLTEDQEFDLSLRESV